MTYYYGICFRANGFLQLTWLLNVLNSHCGVLDFDIDTLKGHFIVCFDDSALARYTVSNDVGEFDRFYTPDEFIKFVIDVDGVEAYAYPLAL